ncbi:MAG: helix-turn-helix transcriptional regulator [Ruminococcaceae bacterium]|nr:helix-turn-helix transcriptional regulator [Oscillospiraceae bacterium]
MLKEQLKKLRTERGCTQSDIAKELGVSSQTVSKWERGLIAPDISLLPQIARFYGCTIDYLFDSDYNNEIERQFAFSEKIKRLNENKDQVGVFQAYCKEIRKRPKNFKLYVNIMHYLWVHHMFDDEYVEKMILFTDYALNYCTEQDIRNDILKKITILCAESNNERIREKAKLYYPMMPSMRNSREIYAKLVFGEKEAIPQIKSNIIYTIQLAECAIRQLIHNNTLPEEIIFLRKKCVALYETVLDHKFGGFWDTPLLNNYLNIAIQFLKCNDPQNAEKYIENIIRTLERHLDPDRENNLSNLLSETQPSRAIHYEDQCKDLLLSMMKNRTLLPFHDKIFSIGKRYCEYYEFPIEPLLQYKEDMQ